LTRGEGEKRVEALHGAGGSAMEEFLADHILNKFGKNGAGEIGLEALDDGSTIDLDLLPGRGSLVLTTDSHLVKPLFFPGGDIGRLAVCGTINDLSVMGASPLALSSALIIEEGFSMDRLDRVLASMEKALEEAGLPLITGDTKVMGAGDLDGLVINTTGLGFAEEPIRDNNLDPGDKVILSGTVGDHGMALMQHREGLSFSSELQSDIAPLNGLLSEVLEVGGVKAMKDPTRGGLAGTLNEMAEKSGQGIFLSEEKIPLRDEVRGIASLIGISPYEVANEGKAVLIVEAEKAEDILEEMRAHPLGQKAAVIGEVVRERPGKVVMETEVGGRRFLERPLGDPVPRIC